jgi:hypothetical protein
MYLNIHFGLLEYFHLLDFIILIITIDKVKSVMTNFYFEQKFIYFNRFVKMLLYSNLTVAIESNKNFSRLV